MAEEVSNKASDLLNRLTSLKKARKDRVSHTLCRQAKALNKIVSNLITESKSQSQYRRRFVPHKLGSDTKYQATSFAIGRASRNYK